MTQANSQTNKVQVIDRASEVLTVLSRHPDGMTLTELARETGLHKATVLRFLTSLQQNGLAEKQASGKHWALGPAIFEMASRAGRRHDLREIARPIMQAICDETGQTVQLAVLGGNEISYVEKVEPADLVVKINSQVGSRRPVHCTALGKAICAHLDWDTARAILDAHGMEARTARTITSPEAFKRELQTVREQGHAMDDREYNDLVTCAAAPVWNAAGIVVAGLSISIPGIASEPEQHAAVVESVKKGAAQVSLKLGWDGRGDDSRGLSGVEPA